MPDTYRVIFTKRASSDLEGIFKYINERSPENAPEAIRAIVDAIDSLELFPQRYPAVALQPRVRRETRRMPVGSYLIYYRILRGSTCRPHHNCPSWR